MEKTGKQIIDLITGHNKSASDMTLIHSFIS